MLVQSGSEKRDRPLISIANTGKSQQLNGPVPCEVGARGSIRVRRTPLSTGSTSLSKPIKMRGRFVNLVVLCPRFLSYLPSREKEVQGARSPPSQHVAFWCTLSET
jgi:hypothetical protein